MSSVAIFIPTYKRADRLLKVYKNAKNSSPLITNVYFIVEKDDQESINVLKTHRPPYFINARSRNYAGAFNTAYLKTSENFFFIGSDDLDFKPGWLEIALKKMVDPIKVVGTNDLHNPSVLRGMHATHMLIDRDYIKERSGTFDSEDLVLSESYIHNQPDREFVEIAKLRGVFVPCLEAVVEHLHWAYGLSPKDGTYAMQDGTSNHDRRLYHRRRPLWTEKIKNEQNQ
jgi:glycosyltransferase involved in cell wall biosynthesis